MIEKHTITGYKSVTLGMASWYSPNYKFTVGKTHTVKNARDDGRPCGEGLHFCLKKKDVEPHTKDKDNHILLQVEANVDDILGMDSSKVRVKSLKVIKVLEKVSKYGAPFKTALKTVKDMKLGTKFLKPKKSTNEATIKLAAVEAMKIMGCKKLHVFSNLFELNYHLEDGGHDFYNCDYKPGHGRLFSGTDSMVLNKMISGTDYKGVGFKALDPSLDFSIPVNKIADKIVYGYLESSSMTPVAERNKLCKALIDMLALGCLPVGNRLGTFLVYLPTETKLSYF